MLNFFLLIHLLLSIEQVHNLMCYKSQSISLTRNQLNSTNLSDLFTLTSEQNQTCQVRLTINSSQQQNNNYAQIHFGSSNNSNEQTRIEFGTTLQFVRQQIRLITSYLDYRCSSKDFCERDFLLKSAIPLFRTVDQPLHNNLIALWKNSSSTPYVCDPLSRTDKCLSYVCFVIYEELKNLSYGKSQCSDPSSTRPVHIYVRTSARNSARSLIEHEYRCMKNDCTGQVVFDSLLTKNRSRSSIARARDKTSNEVNQIIFKQTIIIVGILLIIAAIAYYFQCRNYRQGYRLTISV